MKTINAVVNFPVFVSIEVEDACYEREFTDNVSSADCNYSIARNMILNEAERIFNSSSITPEIKSVIHVEGKHLKEALVHLKD